MLELNFKVYQPHFELIDQLFEMERKLERIQENNSISRNINRMKDILENFLNTSTKSEGGFTYHNPINEKYSETRLDLEASIAGNSSVNLVVTEVIKPIIRYRSGGTTLIARKGVVVVESKNRVIK